ncbi:MAG: NADH-quinone oxidoreductase subunit NuoG [Anaerolineae bacterium]
MVHLTIDGREVSVPEGTVIVEAAKEVGIEIPVFCYHPRLKPIGACRMCLVEVGTPRRGRDGQIELDEEGKPVIAMMPKLQTGCTMPVSEGMVVRTRSQAVVEARRAILEFLLTSHPLDCPICDKGGECPLQDATFAYGPTSSRFHLEEKYHFEKPINLSPLIVFDQERCIFCFRCVRFCHEIAAHHVLNFMERGRGMQLSTFSNPPLGTRYSGNTIDICPVGALTSNAFRFKARSWELDNVPTVCPYCSCGCNIILGTRREGIKRITAGENEAVNEVWICDKGRFGHHFVESGERLTTPLVKKRGKLVPTSWDEVLSLVVKQLGKLAKERPESIGGIGSTRCTNEGNYLFQKFLRAALGTNNVDHRLDWRGDYETTLLPWGVATNSLSAIERAGAILILGGDPSEEQPIVELRVKKAVTQKGAKLVVAHPLETELAGMADLWLQYRPGTEVALLNGLMKAIVARGWQDEQFIEANTEGYAVLKENLKAYPLERVVKITGVSQKALRQAAEAIAQADGLAILCGERVFQNGRGQVILRALVNLALLTGNIGPERGGLYPLLADNNSQGARDMGLLPHLYPGYQKVSDEAVRQRLAELWGTELPSTPGLHVNGMFEGARRSEVKALYVMGADPVAHCPDSELVRGALSKLEFLVVQDLFLTETALMADVVLPATTFAEQDGTFTNLERRVQVVRRGIRPKGESKPDWWIMTEIAKRLTKGAGGARWDYTHPAEIMAEIGQAAPIYAGLTYSALGTEGRQWPWPEGNGRWKFVPARYEPLVEDKEFPFLLLTRTHLFDQGTMIHHSEILHYLVPGPYVAINPTDAGVLGITDGEKLVVSSATGSIELTAAVTEGCPPGTVCLPGNLTEVPVNRLRRWDEPLTKVRVTKPEGQ